MSLTAIQPTKHVVRDTPTSKLFRRKLGFDDIITFWSMETGEWILAYWVNRRIGLVEEMEDLGMAFEKVTPELIDMICTCWKQVDWGEKKRRLLSRERDRTRKMNDDLAEQQRRWDWAKKRMSERGKNPVPYAFKTPIRGGEVL